ncbi:hypothetical protein F4781DRAFT_431035 [Annulohypoxylon bovei var. microspora]|nr:hypothetical protein F4781DRAFT_431035 [Annulohypoxylon bovei var. microspora]
MYFNILSVVFISLLAAKVGATKDAPSIPTWNVEFYSDKECKNVLSTAQIAQNVTCGKHIIGQSTSVLAVKPMGPATFGDGGTAKFSVYTNKDCLATGSGTPRQLTTFGACNTQDGNSYDY